MSTPATRIQIVSPRRALSGGGGGGDDPGSFAEWAVAGSGLRDTQRMGNDYDLRDSGRFTDITASGRLWFAGAYEPATTGTLSSLTVVLNSRASAQSFRAIVYQDDGNASRNDVSTSVCAGRPLTRIGNAGTEVTVPANSGFVEVTFPLPSTPVASGTLYWLGLWPGDAATVCQFVRHHITTHHLKNMTSGAATYVSSGGNPPATLGASVATEGAEVTIWATLVPTATTAPTATATAQSDRSIAVAWSGLDGRTTHVRIERSKSGGAYAVVAVVSASPASYADRDLDTSASYAYRIYALFANAVAGMGQTSSATPGGSRRAYTTAALSLQATSVYIPNPLSGLINYADAYATYPPVDTYEDYNRNGTGYDWRTLEPTQGNYDFSTINAGIATALASGRRFGFRWRCLRGFNGSLVPDYIEPYCDTYGGEVTPRWNDTFVRARMVALWQALGTAYNGENKVAFIDIGGYGTYGEFAVNPGGADPTVATLKTWIDAACGAFSNKPVLINTFEPTLDEALRYGLTTYANLGVQHDAWGNSVAGMYINTFMRFRGQRSESTRKLLDRPGTIRGGEPFNSASIVSPGSLQQMLKDAIAFKTLFLKDTNLQGYSGYGATGQAAINDAIRTMGYRYGVAAVQWPATIVSGDLRPTLAWTNDGVVPTWEQWVVQIQLRAVGSGTLVWSGNSSVSLKNLFSTKGTPHLHTDALTVTGVAAGTYQLAVQVPALNSRTPYMTLSNASMQTGGWYALGSVIVP